MLLLISKLILFFDTNIIIFLIYATIYPSLFSSHLDESFSFYRICNESIELSSSRNHHSTVKTSHIHTYNMCKIHIPLMQSQCYHYYLIQSNPIQSNPTKVPVIISLHMFLHPSFREVCWYIVASCVCHPGTLLQDTLTDYFSISLFQAK